MALSFGRRISLFAASTALAAAVAAGGLGAWLLDRSLTQSLRKQAAEASALTSARLSAELSDLVARARLFASVGAADPLALSQHAYFEGRDDLLSLSLFEKSPWRPRFRWTRPGEDASAVTLQDLEELDLRHPVPLDRVTEGSVELVFGTMGTTRGKTGVLRLAVPYGERGASGYGQALVIEVARDRFTAALEQPPGATAWLVSPSGKLFAASGPGRFAPGDDLSGLEAVRQARSTGNPRGTLEYLAGSAGIQYASYQRLPLGSSSLWLVVQAPRAQVSHVLLRYVEAVGALGALLALLAWAWAGSTSWRLVGAPLQSLREQLDAARKELGFEAGHERPEPTASDDELQRMADSLELIYADLARGGASAAGMKKQAPGSPPSPPLVSSSLAKLKDPEARSRLEASPDRLQGERREATVLHAHVHGLEHMGHPPDPTSLLPALNEFYREASLAIESAGGIVDHSHGGSIVACWGLPEARDTDPEQAMRAALAIREAAARLKLSLSMGLHRGSVVAGEIGPPGRKEYSAVGEAFEVASRIRVFADQFGTDLLVTAPVASRLPQGYALERLAAGDEETPELFGSAAPEAAQAA